jgi:hypothetical protein
MRRTVRRLMGTSRWPVRWTMGGRTMRGRTMRTFRLTSRWPVTGRRKSVKVEEPSLLHLSSFLSTFVTHRRRPLRSHRPAKEEM